jgi:hypothetical protein
MPKPPPDVDPEKFIIGKGGYSNFRTACPYWDEGVFRIDPAPMPFVSIVVYNSIFAAFFYGFHLVTQHVAAGPLLVYWAPLGVGLQTCAFFTAVVYYSFDNALRRGPWLIYDKATGRVDLPREGESFSRSEIVHLQYITTKRLSFGHVSGNDQLSELNLITCRGGVQKRWPLLRSIFNVRAFGWLLKPLLANTDLPVVRVKDEWLGWRVTETPYTG